MSAERKVLIAVDLSENSLKAVDYVGKVIGACHTSVEIALLHVIKEPSPDIIPDEETRREKIEQLRAEGSRLMDEVEKQLTSVGISESCIKINIAICSPTVSYSELILQEQKKGGYGTVVMGRRGLSKREEFLFGSVSSGVMREARECAVWIVP